MKRKHDAKIQYSKKRFKSKHQQLVNSVSAVRQANMQVDPLEPFYTFRTYESNGITVHLYTKKVTDLEDSLKKWIFDLTKRNMLVKYEESSWGWNDSKKMKELMNKNAWYLIAETCDKTPIAFSHFRFDIDQDIEVLYCYELQIESTSRKKGLGKFMMQILELLAFKSKMKKIVLTVLKNNSFSSFFKSIGYVVDESSPLDTADKIFCYEILSKCNNKFFGRE